MQYLLSEEEFKEYKEFLENKKANLCNEKLAEVRVDQFVDGLNSIVKKYRFTPQQLREAEAYGQFRPVSFIRELIQYASGRLKEPVNS